MLCFFGYIPGEYTQHIDIGFGSRNKEEAMKFKSGIWVEKEDRRVNAKSLLGVLSLGIVKGTTITLIADGDDEETAVNTLVELVKDNFGE